MDKSKKGHSKKTSVQSKPRGCLTAFSSTCSISSLQQPLGKRLASLCRSSIAQAG